MLLNIFRKIPRQVDYKHPKELFLQDTESYMYLIHYLTIASFISSEKSQKFFLLFICLLIAKWWFSKGFWGEKKVSYLSAYETRDKTLYFKNPYKRIIS